MPEEAQPQVVIANTTPLMALNLIGQLDLLKAFYEEIWVPEAVWKEIEAGEQIGLDIGTIHEGRASWIHVEKAKDRERLKYLVDLDVGEAEVLILAEELSADRVIIDEKLARQYAKRFGFKVTGTLGILIKAKQKGLIPQVRPLLEELRQKGIWLDDALLETALREAGEA